MNFRTKRTADEINKLADRAKQNIPATWFGTLEEINALRDIALAAQKDAARYQPVGSILKAHLKPCPGPWCKELLLYSPDNQGDGPENRVMIYVVQQELLDEL